MADEREDGELFDDETAKLADALDKVADSLDSLNEIMDSVTLAGFDEDYDDEDFLVREGDSQRIKEVKCAGLAFVEDANEIADTLNETALKLASGEDPKSALNTAKEAVDAIGGLGKTLLGVKTALDKIENESLTDDDVSFAELFEKFREDREMTIKQLSVASGFLGEKSPYYRCRDNPRKENVLAFAVGLKCDLNQATRLLRQAGYAWTSSAFDSCVRFCFKNRQVYDAIDKVNDYLEEKGQPLLGCRNVRNDETG